MAGSVIDIRFYIEVDIVRAANLELDLTRKFVFIHEDIFVKKTFLLKKILAM
jgi:hypothetical protein